MEYSCYNKVCPDMPELIWNVSDLSAGLLCACYWRKRQGRTAVVVRKKGYTVRGDEIEAK